MRLPHGKPSASAESSSSRRVSLKGILWLVAAGLALAVGSTAFWQWFRSGVDACTVPVPPQPAALDAQLRAYIGEKVRWVLAQPCSPERQATLGLVYAANGLWREAQLSFANVVRLNPKEPHGWLYEAIATQESGDADGALKRFRELTRRFPSFAPGFYRFGRAALGAGAVDEAEGAFKKLIALAPGEWRGYAGLGEVKLRQGQNSEAAGLLERAVQLEPEAKSAHNLLGMAYRSLGRMDQAKFELALGLNHVDYPMPDKWSELVPQHMKLLQDQLDIANEMEQSGHPDQAVALLEKALAYHRDDLGLMNNLAIALNRAGEPKKARLVLERALKQNPQFLAAYVTLSFSCQALEANEAALAAADRALSISTNTPQAYLAKANALLAMERDDQAVQALEAALRLDPKNAEIQMELGDVTWKNLQMPREALEHYKAATNLNPILVPVYVRLADLHLTLRDTNAAEQVIQALRQLAPKLPELRMLEERSRKLQQRL